MLEERPCLVSRVLLPRSCEQETNWILMAFRVGDDVSNTKRRNELDLEVEGGLKKVFKGCDDEENLSRPRRDELSSILAAPGQGNDQSNTDSFISALGSDLTTKCISHMSRADYGLIASLNSSFYALIKSGEIYRFRRQNKVVEHWVYFSCRLLEWVAFNPDTQRWIHLPKMNSNECFMCSDKESLAVGTELLVFGRDIMSHVIYKYSILTNSWISGLTMNVPRCLFASASLGEIAILAGGCDTQGNLLSSAELYDSENHTWVTLPSMNKARRMCSGVFMDGKFYVVGGIGGSDGKTILTCGEEYDLMTRTWKVIPGMCPVYHDGFSEIDLPPPAEAPPLLAVVNNELYAGDHNYMTVKKYNKESGTWVIVGKLPERTGSMNGWGLAFRACGERVIVIGGPRSYGDGTVEVNSWMPTEGPPQWRPLARKRVGSFVYNCAVMGC